MGLLDSLGGLIDSLLNTEQGGQQPSVTPITPQRAAVQNMQTNSEPARKTAAQNAGADTQKPQAARGTVPQNEIYLPPASAGLSEEVAHIVLTDAEASAAGWHYRRKSRKRIRITGYTGREQNVTVPAEIGGYTVNEIGKTAFSKVRITGIRIPDTVRKLAEGCLSVNALEEIVFDTRCDLDIPARFAKRCRHLSAVRLPGTVKTMGREAFAECTALQEIDLMHCRDIREMAFAGSGLRTLRMESSIYTLLDGTALLNTPIDQKYSIIARRLPPSEGLRILAFGQKGCALRLPADKVIVERHAVPVRPKRMMILDFSLCTSLHFHESAFFCTYYADDGRTSRECETTVILPENHHNPYIPDCVNVQTAGETPYSGFPARTQDGSDLYEAHRTLPPFQFRRILPCSGLRIREKRLTVRCSNLIYRQEAICSPVLEEITLSRLSGEGQLCHRCCRNLHFAEINGQQMYLPPAGLAGEELHIWLLKALSGKRVSGKYQFFDTAVIDRLFRGELVSKKYRKAPSSALPYWNDRCDFPHLRELTQRQKLLIAADVMRSTPALFPNRAMYAAYLRAHRRFALLLCETLPEDYAAYLRGYYETLAKN